MKAMDKLKNVPINKNIFKYLCIISLIAFLLGSIFILFINSDDKTLVKEYIMKFLENINEKKYNALDYFKQNSILNFSIIVLIWLLGISVIGIPIVLFFNFVKFFSIGFTLASFMLTYGIKGFLLSVIYLLPAQIIYFLMLNILITYSVNISLKIINTIIKKEVLDLKKVMNKYSKILLLSILIIGFIIFYDSYINPLIIKIIMPLFIK